MAKQQTHRIGIWLYSKLITDLTAKLQQGTHKEDLVTCTNEYITMMEEDGRIHWADSNIDEMQQDGDIQERYYLEDILLYFNMDKEDYTDIVPLTIE